MARLGPQSLTNLEHVHPKLKTLCIRAILVRNFSVISGWRDGKEQEEKFAAGESTLHAGQSLHNTLNELGEPCAKAIDLAPYYPESEVPGHIPWKNRELFIAFGAWFVGFAASQGVTLRWGGDWDGDWIFTDQHFNDLGHFELVD